MRDPALYSEHNLWTSADSYLADASLTHSRRHDLSDVDALHASCTSSCTEDFSRQDVERVLNRMQKWPHSLELQAAQQEGVPAKPKKHNPRHSEALITDGTWTIRHADLQDWLMTGALDVPIWEFELVLRSLVL